MGPLKILMPVLWFDEVPGGWTWFLEEAQKIARRGHRVVVLCPRKDPGQYYKGTDNIGVYRFASHPFVARTFLISPFGFLSAVSRLMEREGHIDVVYDTTSGILPVPLLCGLWFVIKRERTPIYVHVHGQMRDLRGKGLVALFFELYLNVVARLNYSVATRIFIMGENCRERVIQLGGRADKVELLANGFQYGDRPSPSLKTRENYLAVRRELGFMDDDFLFAFTGRPTKAKGVDSLLNAFAILSPMAPKARLVFIGEDGERRNMEALADGLGIAHNVRFLGWRHDVPRLLAAMDAYVSMSLSEGGISAALLEAFQSELPCVVTPFYDQKRDGIEVLIVPFADSRSASDAMLRLYQDEGLRRRLGENAVARAKFLMDTHYNWDKYLRRLDELFAEAVHVD